MPDLCVFSLLVNWAIVVSVGFVSCENLGAQKDGLFARNIGGPVHRKGRVITAR